jgi:hypothetical protein
MCYTQEIEILRDFNIAHAEKVAILNEEPLSASKALSNL